MEDVTEEDIKEFAEYADKLADDALKIFRLNIFVITVYATLVGVLLNYRQVIPNVTKLTDITQSRYTVFAMLFWFGSTVVVLLIYGRARQASSLHLNQKDSEFVQRATDVWYWESIFSAAAASLIAVYLFAVGVYDSTTDTVVPLFEVLNVLLISGLPVVMILTLVRAYRRLNQRI